MRINDRGGNPGPLIPNLAEPSMILWKVGGLWVCSEPAGWAPVRARGCSALPGALAGPERWVRPRAAPARGRSSPCAPTAPAGSPDAAQEPAAGAPRGAERLVSASAPAPPLQPRSFLAPLAPLRSDREKMRMGCPPGARMLKEGPQGAPSISHMLSARKTELESTCFSIYPNRKTKTILLVGKIKVIR